MKAYSNKRQKGYYDLDRLGVNRNKKTKSGAKALSREKKMLKKQKRSQLKAEKNEY